MRYEVRQGSETGHCCFGATVVDTEKQEYAHGRLVTDAVPICECYEREDAERICAAMNGQHGDE